MYTIYALLRLIWKLSMMSVNMTKIYILGACFSYSILLTMLNTKLYYLFPIYFCICYYIYYIWVAYWICLVHTYDCSLLANNKYTICNFHMHTYSLCLRAFRFLQYFSKCSADSGL